MNIDYEKLKLAHELIKVWSEKNEKSASISMEYNIPSSNWDCFDLNIDGVWYLFCFIDQLIEELKNLT